MAKIAEFAAKLRETPDGDGNLLDRTVLYFGAGMSNGNVHDRKNTPALLVGHGNGKLKGNRHVVADEKNDEPTANLLLALTDIAGCELDQIGYSWDRVRL